MSTIPNKIILASASPRRKRLLEWLGIEYDVVVTNTPESMDGPAAIDPPALATSIATDKLLAAESLSDPGTLILAFDTIVVVDSELLGKPEDEADARRMLAALSGRSHEVITGCAIRHPAHTSASRFAVSSKVQVQELPAERIERWLAQGEYLGCAGAYNIERQIAEVGLDDCYQNVAGLPLCHLYAALKTMSLPGGESKSLTAPLERCNATLGRVCRLGPKVIR